MARPLRVEYPGAAYHVIARGNERKPVFRDDEDRKRYLERLAFYRERFGFKVYAFCLMENQVHLALETAEAPLSKVMLALHSSYTQAFNRRHGRVGHLFQGRYKAYLVDKEPYLLPLVRYIHESPVKARAARSAAEHAWSSDRFYRRGKGPEWLDMDGVLEVFGGNRARAVRGYRRFMGEEPTRPYEEVRSRGQVIKGDEGFAKRALEQAAPPPRRTGLTVDRVVAAVAAARGFEPAELGSAGRRRPSAQARAMAAWVGRAAGGIPVAQTARFLNRDESSLVRAVAKLEDDLKANPALKGELEEIAGRLRG